MNIYADFSSNFQMKYTNKESPPVGQAPQFEKKLSIGPSIILHTLSFQRKIVINLFFL